ncbi:amino acid adenylation domain-containing protein, partial [Izhakiella capsodis]
MQHHGLHVSSKKNKNEGDKTEPKNYSVFPLSSVQQAIWLDQQLNPELINHNIGSVATIEGEVDPVAMSQAFRTVVARHDVFHLRMDSHGKPLQYFSDSLLPALEFQDVSLNSNYNDLNLEKDIDDRFNRPFSLNDVLWRATLFKFSTKRFYLQFCCHHLVSDGMSLSLLNVEIADIYSKLIKGNKYLPEPALSYRDFITDDIAYRESERFFKDECFWLKRFETLPPPFFYPLKNKALNSAPSLRPVIWSLSNQKFIQIENLAQNYGLSVLHFMYAIFSCYFIRINCIDEISIGIPLHNRRSASHKKAMGMFATVIPVRIKVSAEDSFTDIMRKASVELRNCYKHQRMPVAEIQRKLKIQKRTGRSHLFDMSLSYEPYDVDLHLEEAVIHSIRPHHKAQYPLAVTINRYKFINNEHCDNPITIDFDFSSNYMTFDDVVTMKNRLTALLEGVLKDENVPVFQLPLLSHNERQFFMKQNNLQQIKMAHNGLIHELFERQVKKTPLTIAAVFEEKQLSYTELNQRANHLAHHLIERGVKPNDRVAICLDRGLDMLVGILAILKAGGAYIPLDPVYPSDRLEYILEDSAPAILVTRRDLTNQFDCVIPTCFIDALSAVTSGSDFKHNPVISSQELHSGSLAYVIYTSGSTGQPKGVMVEHGSVVRLLLATEAHFNFDNNDVWTLCHSFSFDFSVWELFGALCHGGKLVIVSSECTRSPQALFELICREKVTVLNQTPGAFRQLIEAQGNAHHSLRCVIFGGEALETRMLIPWVNKKSNINTRLINMYGITEITVHATFYEIIPSDIDPHAGSIIGSPLADLCIYILDEHGQLAPLGVPGELYIAGDGVARGYLNLPDLTASRFLDDPFSS